MARARLRLQPGRGHTITLADPARGFTTIRPMGPELFDALDALDPRPPLENM